MCPVVLLALLFSFLLFLLEITAAITVTFSVPKVVVKEEEFNTTYFNFSDASPSQPDCMYQIISEDASIASIINGTFTDGSPQNRSVLVRGNFLGKTFIHVEKRVNGSVTEVSKSLPIAVVRQMSALTKAFTVSVIVLVSLNYINMGCALDLSVVFTVLKKPVAPAIGFVSQYAIMPLVSYCLARLLFDDVILQLGLFMFGCSPGGGASNMWTVLLNGNLNLSLTMTFISNLFAFGMIPLWLFTLGRSLFSDIATELPVRSILMTLIFMLIPLGIGLAFQRWLPRVAKFCRRILATASICMIIFIIIFGTYANLYMFSLFTWQILVAASVNVWLGFMFGSVISKSFDLPIEDIIAVAVETGIQNVGIAYVLLGFSLHQPESDIAKAVPVAASIMTPLPLLCAYAFLKIRERYLPKVPESRLYVTDDDEEKKTLPTPDSTESMLGAKLM